MHTILILALAAARYVFTPPPPPKYCVETRECCLKKEDCVILRHLPAVRW